MEPPRNHPTAPWLDDFARDVGYGLRTLRRHPGFTATALLSLALGIGASAGIFSLLDQVLLRALAVSEPERLVLLDWNGSKIGVEYGSGSLMSYPLCRDLQTQDRFFDGVVCRHPLGVNISTGREHEEVTAEIVSGSYFQVLGVQPLLGRLIAPSDDLQPLAHPVAVLSYDYWTNRLGSPRDIVGRRVLINNNPLTVIGVAPASFRGMDVGDAASVWIPAMMKRLATPDWDGLFDRRVHWMHVIGRLKPGVTLEQARTGLQPWFKATLDADTRREGFPNITEAQRRSFLASTIDVSSASRGISGLRVALSRPLQVLMGGTLILLLLASLNVAGLLLARGATRVRELTTRLAIGASRGRIARQLLVESLLVALAGGALGVLTAPLVSRALRSFVPQASNLNAGVDVRVLTFAIVISVATAALCGLAPVFQVGRLQLSAALADRSNLFAGGVRLRKLLVAGQIALALLLLMGAGLFVQTLARLQAKGPGFATDNLLMFSLDPPSIGYSYDDSERVMREVFRRLQELPEVERAGVGNTQMLNGGITAGSVTIQAEERKVSDRPVHRMRVSPGFFSTLGVRVTAGRDFDARDVRAPGTPPGPYRTVIVNQNFARRYFGDRNPVGARIGLGSRVDTQTNIEIIGVVREELSRRDLRDEGLEQIFMCFWDNQSENGAFYARVRGTPESAFASIRRTVAAVEPALAVEPTTFDDQIERSLWTERALATLSSGFGATALLICIIGVYGVMAFVATQRTREIGVRLALGATRTSAVWVVVRDALSMIVAGTLIAVPGAWALRRLVEAEIFGVHAFDAPTIATAGTGLALAVLSAAAMPALRAAMLPPMLAIRDQPESVWQSARGNVRRALRVITPSRERSAVPSLSMIGEFTGLVQRAASFPEALHVALPALRQRVGAQFILLLEKVSKEEYRGGDCVISSRGILINRLTHYPHPLPLQPSDFDAWSKWAREFRPEHVAEVERLKASDARLAVALRTRREIVGVLLLGPPEGRDAFTDSDKQVLGSAAELFALMIENARLNDRAMEQEKVRRDLALAAEVQRRLLPPQPPAASAASFAAYTMPARSVGGDFYDFVDVGDGRIGVAIADVAGKGIAAALLTSVVQASLRVISVESGITPSQLASRMNRFLHRSTGGSNYATFFYAQLEPDGRRLRYVNAGHNPPYLVRRIEERVELMELGTGGTVLGLFPDVPYEDAEIDLRPGDLLVAFTDGVTEARRTDGEEFGEDRLKDLLRDVCGTPADDVSVRIATRMREWTAGAEQHDDLTVVVATMHAPTRG